MSKTILKAQELFDYIMAYPSSFYNYPSGFCHSESPIEIQSIHSCTHKLDRAFQMYTSKDRDCGMAVPTLLLRSERKEHQFRNGDNG